MNKRIISIQDISCFGKCSQTVVLPILSSAKVETVMLPTALLSTHTGGLKGYTYLDLQDQFMPITNHWKSLNLDFYGILTGYLGNTKLIDNILELIRDMMPPFMMCDPAFGDNGKLYTGFDQEYVDRMRELCFASDIIVPNLTEACMLLGIYPEDPPYTKEYIEKIAKKLRRDNVSIVVLTGVCFNENELGAVVYDGNQFHYYFREKIDGYYHGTGDIFAASFLGAYLNNNSLEDCIKIAVDFTCDSILRTYNEKTDVRFGVNFEAGLGEYAKRVDNG